MMQTAEEFARRLADCTRTVYRKTRTVGICTDFKAMHALIEADRLAAKLELLNELAEDAAREWYSNMTSAFLAARAKYSQPGQPTKGEKL